MSILFVGSAPDDLGGVTIPYVGTAQDVRDPDFTPVASQVPDAALQNSQAAPFSVMFANTSDMWMHYRTKWVGNALTSNSDGHFYVVYSGETEIMRINILNGEPNVLDSAAGTATYPNFTYGATYTVDLHIVDNGATFTFEMYVGGILQVTHTWTDASVGVDRVIFSHDDFDNNTFSLDIYYSEFIVTDAESTIGWRLSSVPATADGFHTAWVGDYLGVNELGDGIGLSSETVGDKESWVLADYAGPVSPGGVRGLVTKYVAAKGNSGPQNIIPFLRIGGTDYEGAALTLNNTPAIIEWGDNPATALPWVTGDFVSLEAGVKADT